MLASRILRPVFASASLGACYCNYSAMTNTEITIASPNWQVESARLTVFFSRSVSVVNPNWWASTIGSEPESRTAKPARGEYVEWGNYLNNALTLSVQPGRADWILSVSQAQFEDMEIKLKTVGPLASVAADFATVMNVWLKNCPSIIRLAYGAVLLEPVADQRAGYRRLSQYLHSVKIDESSSDFFYQINRPRPLQNSKENVTINRLSRWSVQAAQAVRMAFSLASPSVPNPPVVFTQPDSAAHACRLEMDLSTHASRENELVPGELPVIFGELMSLGSEIAHRGDIP